MDRSHSIYKCRLCGEVIVSAFTFDTDQLWATVGALGVDSLRVTSYQPLPLVSWHECAKDAIGVTDFVGFRRDAESEADGG